jgi:protein MpaA
VNVSVAVTQVSRIALVLVIVGIAANGLAPGASPADSTGSRSIVLGRSVDGRPITAVETGDSDAPRKALVVGCIHGNETAGIAVARRLAQGPPPRELDLWIIPDLNPDGAAAGTRGNAHHVDLNRNFPWRWRRLGGVYNSGPHPLSEPESRIADRFIAQLKPDVTIWFHQHLDVVDDSEGNVGVERRFARLADMRLARLRSEPGSAVGWENQRDRSDTAFVVELHSGFLAAAEVTRFAQAVVAAAETSY